MNDMQQSDKPESTSTFQVPRDENGRVLPGHSLNPAGRPKGSRNKLTNEYLNALLEDFRKHGVASIVEMRETKPVQYNMIISKVINSAVDEKVEDGELQVLIADFRGVRD